MSVNIQIACFQFFGLGGIVGLLVASFILYIVATMLEMENGEFLNCVIATIIARIITFVIFFFIPFEILYGGLLVLGILVGLAINAWVIANVLGTNMGKAYFAAILMMIFGYIF